MDPPSQAHRPRLRRVQTCVEVGADQRGVGGDGVADGLKGGPGPTGLQITLLRECGGGQTEAACGNGRHEDRRHGDHGQGEDED